MILPGATLGVLGGGQLGRMFTLAAHSMGYHVVVLDPDPHSPAGRIAGQHIQAGYTDHAGLQLLGNECAAITTEFENVPADSLEYLDQFCPVRPDAGAVRIAQDRIREKNLFREHDLATAPFIAIYEAGDLEDAFGELTPPLLLKTATLGYDGKGQIQVGTLEQAVAAFEQLGSRNCILEEVIDLDCEISVIVARGIDGHMVSYPVGENRHVHGILDTTLVPARIDNSISERAVDMARRLATALDYCGVLAVEFFHTRDGALLINEMATRPHNSGHYTVDACVTSQFAQQVRCMCGLPPGASDLLTPVVMTNLLGDIWDNGLPAWEHILNEPYAHLHLYGKHVARPGRKMGHFNCLAGDVDGALQLATRIRERLGF
ncbi:MAG TPA: 5-(carboxyamino)imidazole ribonucleotide synthase [Gammaproteobacteria bacterium]|nr:5-(carboxyamino)imidazole ribonucleotide synthase [Gammaproteobacteria bacterium]